MTAKPGIYDRSQIDIFHIHGIEFAQRIHNHQIRVEV